MRKATELASTSLTGRRDHAVIGEKVTPIVESMYGRVKGFETIVNSAVKELEALMHEFTLATAHQTRLDLELIDVNQKVEEAIRILKYEHGHLNFDGIEEEPLPKSVPAPVYDFYPGEKPKKVTVDAPVERAEIGIEQTKAERGAAAAAEARLGKENQMN
ncbi:unnamed protein product, partial [Mesorhabditis spiculigera]